MGTYNNCYDILKDVRLGINEYSTALLQGTSTSGKYDNDWLVARINQAQRNLYSKIMNRHPDVFLTSTDVTVTSSVITKPWDFGRIIRLNDENGLKVYRSKVGVLPVYNGIGSDRLYYEAANNQLILNKSGVSATYKMFYYRKPRDMNQGKASAAATLASTAKMIADYYNNIILEDITGAWVDTITDYTSARVVTLTETLSKDDYYGTVSDLPEPFHIFISPLAIILAKSMHPRSQEKPSATEIAALGEQIDDALDAYEGGYGDVSMEEIWTDYGTDDAGFAGVAFPGATGLI